MKKTVKAFILPILALIFCVLLASCGADKDADAEIHSLSVGYLTESAYNNGNYSENRSRLREG